MAAAASTHTLRFIDIGANLTDAVFHGLYRGSRKHADDFAQVLQRAWAAGMQRIVITAGTLADVHKALVLCRQDERLFTTVGVHPTRAQELEQGGEQYMKQLLDLAQANRDKVVAIGELGLDWDRLQFCPKDIQLKWFEAQLTLAEQTGLPLFLHMRNCADDFFPILERNRGRFRGGVVHSFDDTAEAVARCRALGLHIGINGCSLRSVESLEVVRSIPRELLLLETDAPYCDIRPTHPGHKLIRTQLPSTKPEKFELGKCVKGRNEPAHIVQVAEVLAGARGEDVATLANAAYENTERLFFSQVKSSTGTAAAPAPAVAAAATSVGVAKQDGNGLAALLTSLSTATVGAQGQP
jgi:TatD DNase family protein